MEKLDFLAYTAYNLGIQFFFSISKYLDLKSYVGFCSPAPPPHNLIGIRGTSSLRKHVSNKSIRVID